MTKFVMIIVGIMVVLNVLLSPVSLQAKEPLIIVTDPWPPFSINENQNLKGTDVEIIEAIFAELKIPITIKIYPWKRCVAMVETQKADAILDISITQERKVFLSFPNEPVSNGVTVFFTKREKQIPFSTLQDLNGLRAGALLGYSYCADLDKTPFMRNASRVRALEQNFRKLLADRIDILVAVDAVGFSTAQKMGISDQIKIIPNAHYCRGGNYLAFAKKTGHDLLADKFGKALRIFKTTKSHLQILQKYGIKKT